MSPRPWWHDRDACEQAEPDLDPVALARVAENDGGVQPALAFSVDSRYSKGAASRSAKTETPLLQEGGE